MVNSTAGVCVCLPTGLSVSGEMVFTVDVDTIVLSVIGIPERVTDTTILASTTTVGIETSNVACPMVADGTILCVAVWAVARMCGVSNCKGVFTVVVNATVVSVIGSGTCKGGE